MVILLLFHLVQVFVWGAYKRPRELTWMTGVLLLGATLGLAFTGYLLPWDEKAYWSSKVGLGIVGTVPVIGERVKLLLQGGPDMGNLTLTRFFTLHGFVLPGTVIALVVVHLYFFRLHGVTTAWWERDELIESKTEPFWPGQVWKDGVVCLGLLLILTIWVFIHPAPLGAVADPSKAYEARPEWYFMFLFQILRYFHGRYEVVGTFILPSLFFGVMFFWPFLDRNPARDPRRRPLAMTLLGVSTVGLVGLTIFAVAGDVRMTQPEIARAAQGRRRAVAKAGRRRSLFHELPGMSWRGWDGKRLARCPAHPPRPDQRDMAEDPVRAELQRPNPRRQRPRDARFQGQAHAGANSCAGGLRLGIRGQGAGIKMRTLRGSWLSLPRVQGRGDQGVWDCIIPIRWE